MVAAHELPKHHPVKVLLDERDRLLTMKRRCEDTVEKAKRNMILHRALAGEHRENVKRIEAAIKEILPKLQTKDDDHAG